MFGTKRQRTNIELPFLIMIPQGNIPRFGLLHAFTSTREKKYTIFYFRYNNPASEY